MEAPSTEVQRMMFKLYTTTPSIEPHRVVEVMHRWIQGRRLDEVLIDVADYSHVHDGPGVVLIGHEGNYSVDRLDGRLGLTFQRKRSVAGSLAARLASALRSTL